MALVIAKILMRRKVSTSSLANLSVALQWTGKTKEAMKASKLALEMSNPNDTSHEILELNFGTMELACNPINSEGWQRLNARLGKGLSASERTEIYSNLWDGKPCNELCLWDEQGYGDTLMAIRWIPAALRCKDAKIRRRKLVRLIQERYDVQKIVN